MDRLEAQRRLFTAIQVLMQKGWTEKQVDALINGLHREDAVDAAERQAEVTGEVERECRCGRIMSLREATEQRACNDCVAS